jgi:hypothetical protein
MQYIDQLRRKLEERIKNCNSVVERKFEINGSEFGFVGYGIEMVQEEEGIIKVDQSEAGSRVSIWGEAALPFELVITSDKLGLINGELSFGLTDSLEKGRMVRYKVEDEIDFEDEVDSKRDDPDDDTHQPIENKDDNENDDPDDDDTHQSIENKDDNENDDPDDDAHQPIENKDDNENDDPDDDTHQPIGNDDEDNDEEDNDEKETIGSEGEKGITEIPVNKNGEYPIDRGKIKSEGNGRKVTLSMKYVTLVIEGFGEERRLMYKDTMSNGGYFIVEIRSRKEIESIKREEVLEEFQKIAEDINGDKHGVARGISQILNDNDVRVVMSSTT